MNKIKRIMNPVLICILAIGILLMGIPLGSMVINVKAESEESGTIGEGLTWQYSSDGTLTISGNGSMPDYTTENYYYTGIITDVPWKDYLSDITKVVIEGDINNIGKCAFSDCISINEVSLSSSVKEIGESAFARCTALTSISFPNMLVSIGQDAFRGCTGIKSVTIPDSVTTIRSGAFQACTNLTDVRLSRNISSISSCTFASCTKLKNIEIPPNITYIGAWAFSLCSSISELDLPISIDSIWNEAFSNCSSLKKVIVNNDFLYYNESVFDNCSCNFVLYGNRGSTSERYAEENSYAFVAMDGEQIPSSTSTPTVTPNSSHTPFEGDLANPRVSSDGVTTWDCIYFGNYWQEDTNGDGEADKNDEKTPIKWRVLSVDGDDAFLLADKNLDAQIYNNEMFSGATWETCTMRSWLNGYFLDNAFSVSEQSAIRTTNIVNSASPEYGTEGGNDTSDKVYLLSFDEVTNPTYGFSSDYSKNDESRRAKNTEYAKAQGAYTNASEEYIGNGVWWLRSPGFQSSNVSDVKYSGYVYRFGSNIFLNARAVRAALHLNLKASSDVGSPSSWSYAGTVNSDGTMDEQVPPPTPTATVAPTKIPMATPTQVPTSTPVATAKPTIKPTQTPMPTLKPTNKPGIFPTLEPLTTAKPTAEPIVTPSASPESSATVTPDLEPTTEPADQPTEQPQAPSDPAPIQPSSQVTTPSGPVPPASTAVTKPEQDEDDDESDDDDFEDEDEKLKKGSYFMSGNFGYKVTKLKKKKGEIAVVCVKSKNSKAYVIPNKVKKQGITFTVTSIQANAFQGCKKAKTLNMKAAGIKAIGKKALNGLNKKIQIKVPKKKLWIYRKMLQKCGYRTVKS